MECTDQNYWVASFSIQGYEKVSIGILQFEQQSIFININ